MPDKLAAGQRVGFGHPPEHTRFRPGVSGNPSGRPRGSKSLKVDLRDELNQIVRIREGGREIEVTKQKAIIKALLARAMEGDAKAAQVVFAECVRAFGNEVEDEPNKPPSDDEFKLLEDFVAREKKRRAAAARDSNAPSYSDDSTKGDSTNET